MNNKQSFMIAAAVAIGISCPMTKADNDITNSYFSTPMAGTTVEVSTSAPVMIEKSTSSSDMIEKTISSPVVIENTAPPPVVLEDRIIKQKHKFGLGIWPLFDFEIL